MKEDKKKKEKEEKERLVFSSRRRHTRCALVTGVQTCALPISFSIDAADPTYSRAGSLPQWIFRGHKTCARPQFAASPVGAKLARDSGSAFSIDASWPGAIASRLAPTVDLQGA